MNDQVTTLSSTMAKVNDELGTFETKNDAATTFLVKDATAANAAKVENVGLDGLIQGHGQVLTGEITPSPTVVAGPHDPGDADRPGVKDPRPTPWSDPQRLDPVDPDQQRPGPGNHLPRQVVLAWWTWATDRSTPSRCWSTATAEAVTLTLSGFGSGGGESLVGQALVGTP